MLGGNREDSGAFLFVRHTSVVWLAQFAYAKVGLLLFDLTVWLAEIHLLESFVLGLSPPTSLRGWTYNKLLDQMVRIFNLFLIIHQHTRHSSVLFVLLLLRASCRSDDTTSKWRPRADKFLVTSISTYISEQAKRKEQTISEEPWAWIAFFPFWLASVQFRDTDELHAKKFRHWTGLCSVHFLFLCDH